MAGETDRPLDGQATLRSGRTLVYSARAEKIAEGKLPPDVAFSQYVQSVMDDKGISYMEAAELASREQPELLRLYTATGGHEVAEWRTAAWPH